MDKNKSLDAKGMQALSLDDLGGVTGGNSPYVFVDSSRMYPGFVEKGSVYCIYQKPLPCPDCGAVYADVRFGTYKGARKWICTMCGTIHDLDSATEQQLLKMK
ncbi:MAG: hypothetical protein Q4D81_11845 [Eubacteriales bacterium]|nr:hypothetical protein [Eubacteriales bacterium]